jgi:hypothetical protein
VRIRVRSEYFVWDETLPATHSTSSATAESARFPTGSTRRGRSATEDQRRQGPSAVLRERPNPGTEYHRSVAAARPCNELGCDIPEVGICSQRDRPLRSPLLYNSVDIALWRRSHAVSLCPVRFLFLSRDSINHRPATLLDFAPDYTPRGGQICGYASG